MGILEKKAVNCRSVGGGAPEPPLNSGHWGLRPQTPALLLFPNVVAFVECVSIALNIRYYCTSKITKVTHHKCFGFVFPRLLLLQLVPIFTSNSAGFVGGGAKIFFAPGFLVPKLLYW